MARQSTSDRSFPDDRELDVLVDGTRGAQPWRRVFHATNGCLVAVALGGLGIPASVMSVALGLLLIVLVGLDLARLRVSRLNVLFFRSFRLLASPREAEGAASSTWYVAGMILALLLFPLDAALTGILVLALADPAASYLGRRFGRVPLGRGTVEGTAVFFCSAVFAGLLVVPAPAALSAAVAATVLEPIPWAIDDNFTIPLAAGAGAFLLQLLG